ncbi:LuxR C-terminal-related transcriptional regulator [Streptomyces sp. NPDC053794]|uniref:helix-turn-helix transcriptional regulator n=1 Tax=Streptomyces sp. NPDC053794 TaxID=3154760 RepID=UPI0034450D22
MAKTAEPMVGRSAERRTLARAVSRLGEGPGQVVEITGGPGIGKTRLLAELGRTAAAAGCTVRAGRAAAHGAGTTAEVFRALLDAEGPVDASYLRERMESIAPAAGLVVLLDGLERADTDCLSTLHGLFGHPPKAPVLFALAYRHRQASPPLRALLGTALTGGLLVEGIRLGPLSRQEAASLTGPAARPGGDPRALYRAAEGNPLYLKLLTRAGDVLGEKNSDGADGADGAGGGDGVIAAYEAEIARDLARVSATARQVARAASVVGESFTSELVASAVGMDELPVLAALDELVGEDLVRPAEAPRSFTFRHPLLRDAVYGSAPPGWRVAVHTGVAATLTRRGANAPDLARHIEYAGRAGDLDAVRVLADAARQVRLERPEYAVRWLRAALRLLPADAGALRDRLRLRLARLLGAIGRLQESRDLLHTVLEELPRDPAGRHAEAVAACALTERSLGRRAAARSLLADALRGVGGQDADAVGVLEFALAHGDLADARPADCADRAAHALDDAQRYGDRARATAAHALLSLTGVLTGDVATAREHRTSAAAHLDGLLDGQVVERLDAAVWLGWSEALLGRQPEALAHLDRAVTLARGSAREFALVHLLTGRAFAAQLAGRLGEAESAATEALDLAVRCGAHEARAAALALLCRNAVATGDHEAALRAGDAALGRQPRVPDDWFGASVVLAVAEARLAAGDATACLAAVHDVGGAALTAVDAWSRVDWCELLARAALTDGRTDTAAYWAGRAMDVARPLCLPGRTGLALLARGHVLLAEQPEAAYGMAVAAYEGLTAAGQTVDAHRARLLAATSLAAGGDSRRASAELALVQDVFTRCGARALARTASTERRRVLGRAAHPAAGGERAVELLTRREGEVAALVSEGLTNRQIAHRLKVTEKTVQMHLSHAFAKLRVPSRAARARAVVRAAMST